MDFFKTLLNIPDFVLPTSCFLPSGQTMVTFFGDFILNPSDISQFSESSISIRIVCPPAGAVPEILLNPDICGFRMIFSNPGVPGLTPSTQVMNSCSGDALHAWQSLLVCAKGISGNVVKFSLSTDFQFSSCFQKRS